MGAYAHLESVMPIGTLGMGEEKALRLIIEQGENEAYRTLAGVMTGVGFLLVLISFGARRKRRGSQIKTEKKPAA